LLYEQGEGRYPHQAIDPCDFELKSAGNRASKPEIEKIEVGEMEIAN
jgi:hypothetical protein